MHGANRPPFTAVARNQQQQIAADRPFGLPAGSIEITLDLPMPPSINRLWGWGPGGAYRTVKYRKWREQADMTVMATKKPGRLQKIPGRFEIQVLLNEQMSKADGDNVSFKALLDWLQSRDIIRNDRDSRRWAGEWVSADRAPKGCRVILRSLHG